MQTADLSVLSDDEVARLHGQALSGQEAALHLVGPTSDVEVDGIYVSVCAVERAYRTEIWRRTLKACAAPDADQRLARLNASLQAAARERHHTRGAA